MPSGKHNLITAGATGSMFFTVTKYFSLKCVFGILPAYVYIVNFCPLLYYRQAVDSYYWYYAGKLSLLFLVITGALVVLFFFSAVYNV